MKSFDLVIIGGGPIGIACGLEAKKNNLNYLIIEKGPIVNSLFNYPSNMQFFSSSEKLEIDEIPFISIEAKPKRDEALEYYRRIVTSNKLNIHLFEKVEGARKVDNSFTITTDKSGEELPKVSHYYNNPHFYASQKLAVIGASNSAIDAALECYRKGSEVSLIIRGPEVGKRVKYWVRPDIINRIEEGSIKVLTGYRPNFDFLQNMGVELSNDEKKIPTYNADTMESNVSGLYLAGVICGGMETHKWFIENSRIHAKIIVKDISSKKS